MQTKEKIQIALMRSMMERMDGHKPLSESLEREANIISEAVSGNRQQVTRDQIIDLINKADADPKSNGKWVSVTYVNYREPYKTKRSWRTDDVTAALDAHKDRGEEEWYKNLSDYNKPDAKGKNPVALVVAVNRYLLHWLSDANFAKKYGWYKDSLADLRMKNGIAITTDGMLGDNNNMRQKSDTGVQFNQTGKMSKDFNLAGSKCTSTAYLVNEQGNIITELPGEVITSITPIKAAPKPEKAVADVLSGPVLDAYMKAKAELDAKFTPANFLFDKILCISVGINGVSYYYINDKLATPIAKGSDVMVNPKEMLDIAKEQLGVSFDEIQGFAN